ncbi:putative DMT superfamily transporter inner membrane protein [Roseovarius tolerans]|uniref:Putative DMT superfamily transporter inner membrane protein n=1 Tax=Roseovarius tolerans TaxID=74031 RepID=A0A0L6CWT1_9RHOB|nr:EamA family transporter RarD [Roseovarius tolerans]KNX41933.1 putative DMT superfamily transporter inner membrane protein [Roseovarius tolerans]
MREATKGIIAMVATCTVWGLSGIYYKLLDHIPPIEILAHRTLWSCVFFAFVLLMQGRISVLGQALAGRKSILLIGFAALMISTNWFVFITSIQIGRAMEASLGYYIFPLVAVLLGAIAFRERLGKAQLFAVALALCAVVTLTWGLGVPPWIALILATSFGLYGLVKKGLSVGPVVSVTAEVLLLSPIALTVLWYFHSDGHGAFGVNWRDSLLLMFSGILTGTPLIMFSYATKRVTLATVGLVQYLNPTLQFLVATLIFQEAFSFWHAVAFAMIWTALAIYTTASLRQDRAARRAILKS